MRGLHCLTNTLMFAFAIAVHSAEGEQAGWRAVDVNAVVLLAFVTVLAALAAFQHFFCTSRHNGGASEDPYVLFTSRVVHALSNRHRIRSATSMRSALRMTDML
jgi:hypothetical protein